MNKYEVEVDMSGVKSTYTVLAHTASFAFSAVMDMFRDDRGVVNPTCTFNSAKLVEGEE